MRAESFETVFLHWFNFCAFLCEFVRFNGKSVTVRHVDKDLDPYNFILEKSSQVFKMNGGVIKL